MSDTYERLVRDIHNLRNPRLHYDSVATLVSHLCTLVSKPLVGILTMVLMAIVRTRRHSMLAKCLMKVIPLIALLSTKLIDDELQYIHPDLTNITMQIVPRLIPTFTAEALDDLFRTFIMRLCTQQASGQYMFDSASDDGADDGDDDASDNDHNSLFDYQLQQAYIYKTNEERTLDRLNRHHQITLYSVDQQLEHTVFYNDSIDQYVKNLLHSTRIPLPYYIGQEYIIDSTHYDATLPPQWWSQAWKRWHGVRLLPAIDLQESIRARALHISDSTCDARISLSTIEEGMVAVLDINPPYIDASRAVTGLWTEQRWLFERGRKDAIEVIDILCACGNKRL